jgi:pyruvate kinase
VVAVLADLSGPKIRVGTFVGGAIELKVDWKIVVTTRAVQGGAELIPCSYPALADDVEPGDRILLDDGKLELRVVVVEDTEITCRVVHGGRLSDRKGINLPGVAISTPALTAKDRVDAAFAVGLGVDLLSLSFVRTAADIQALRVLCGELGRTPAIVAKIEKPEALLNADAILEVSDAIMVARGDLGVELPPEQVPLAQEQLIHAARVAHKPVIVATQMLESMVTSARPTRAEVSDVAGAVRSGADAVMLSAESAVGAFPVRSVQTMDAVCRQTEAYLWATGAFGAYRARETPRSSKGPRRASVDDAVAESVAQLSRTLGARVIVAFTRSGQTAATICASRPACPVVTMSPNPRTARFMALLWGAIPALAEDAQSHDPTALVHAALQAHDLGLDGVVGLVVQGMHADPAMNLPCVTVVQLSPRQI